MKYGLLLLLLLLLLLFRLHVAIHQILLLKNVSIMFVLMKNLFACVWRFYGPVNPIGSCRAQPVYLTTHLLGAGLVLYCAHSFARN